MLKKGYFDDGSNWIIPAEDLGLAKRIGPLLLRKHRKKTYKDKNGNKVKRIYKRAVWCQQSTNKEKVIVLYEIDFPENKKTELWLIYWIVGSRKKPVGARWRYGQYGVMVPKKDLSKLLNFAKEKGLI